MGFMSPNSITALELIECLSGIRAHEAMYGMDFGILSNSTLTGPTWRHMATPSAARSTAMASGANSAETYWRLK